MRSTNHSMIATFAWLLLTLPALAAADASDDRAAAAFAELTTLVGEWEGRFADGRLHRVAYRLTAGGAVLVETWALAPGRESMTMYHRDGDALLADHYCPQGNTPRLALAKVGADGTMSFEFRDGANLDVPGKSHQHAFRIRRTGPDAYERSETYVENGTPAGDAVADAPIAYTRIAPGASSER